MTQQQRPTRTTPRWRALVAYLAAMSFVVVGVLVYVLLERLPTEVLSIIATLGCAAGVTVPTTLVALSVLLRRAQASAVPPEPQQPQMTRPVVMTVPPMMIQQPQAPPRVVVEDVPRERRFQVVGGEEEWR